MSVVAGSGVAVMVSSFAMQWTGTFWSPVLSHFELVEGAGWNPVGSVYLSGLPVTYE